VEHLGEASEMIPASSISHTPWVGIAALVAMFLIPFIPARFFEGPRTVKHWPRRHVCGDCGAAWHEGHVCAGEATQAPPPLRGELPPLRAELRRIEEPATRELAEDERDLVLWAGEE
jgi:hypothetical protein